MERKRKLQRGAADLVAVAVGFLVLAITAVGTSSALLYGRQALVNEEHYKVATYLLRGELEQEVARFQLLEDVRSNPASYLSFIPVTYDLDSPNDRNGNAAITRCRITREPVRRIDLITTGPGTDYYIIEMSAEWINTATAGATIEKRSGRNAGEGVRKITLVTTFVGRGDI